MRSRVNPGTTPPAFLIPVQRGVLQRKWACGGTPGSTGECGGYRKKLESATLQRSAQHCSTLGLHPSEVPPIVNEVLRSPGQPLDLAARTFMEPRFGHDFSRVRVHTDAPAASLARTVHARAFTVNHNLVFAAGEYAPQTASGRRLLSHELAHVVQQSALGQVPDSMGLVGDRSEHEADAAAEAVEAGRMASVRAQVNPAAVCPMLQRKELSEDNSDSLETATNVMRIEPAVVRGNSAGDPASQILYYNDLFAIPPQTQEFEMSQVIGELNGLKIDKKKVANLSWPQVKAVLTAERKKITGYEIDSKVPVIQSRKRSSLGLTLWQVLVGGVPNLLPWGSELDLARKLFGAPPTDALVTIRITPDGNASIQLVAEKTSAVRAQGPGGAATALKDEFGVVEISGEDGGQWTESELDKVATAFRLLPPEDRSAVAGIRLIKVLTLPGANAHFQHLIGQVSVLRVADTTFQKPEGDVDASGFVGGTEQALPASIGVILHEVGHAVESQPTRNWEKQVTEAKKNVEAEDAKTGDTPRKTPELAKAGQDLDAIISKKSEVLISPEALLPFQQAADSTKALYDEAIAAARAGNIETQQLDLLTESGAALQKLLDHVNPNTLLEGYHSWLEKRASWDPKLDSVVNAQADWAKAAVDLAYAQRRSRRLQKFVDLVEANNIKRFTLYSEKEWPQRPKEFFAEAYSLFLTDPEFLRTNYNVVFTFFKSGDFR